MTNEFGIDLEMEAVDGKVTCYIVACLCAVAISSREERSKIEELY